MRYNRSVVRGLIVWLAGLALGSLMAWRGNAAAPPAANAVRAEGVLYQMLAADFHVHSFPGDGALLPWDLAAEARRRGLDAIALTNHNHMLQLRAAALARAWMPRDLLILPGEEVTSPGFHVAAVGIDRLARWAHSPRAVIDGIHARGGVAIAAHPGRHDASLFDDEAFRRLDGVELNYPMREADPDALRELEAFYARARAAHPGIAAIGSSDFHREAPVGTNRTFVFATTRTEAGIVEAVRAGRTAACDGRGVTVGHEPWAGLASAACREAMSRAPYSEARAGGLANAFAVCCALIGLAAMIVPRA